MKVDPPDEIIASVGANITNSSSVPIMVTITGDTGEEVLIEVAANSVRNWKPPAGWQSATFNSPGQTEVFRLIKQ